MRKFMKQIGVVMAVVLAITIIAPAAATRAATAPKLNVTKRTIRVGGKIFDFNVIADKVSDYKITYSVADKDMVKVDPNNGKVRALSVGNDATTTLTATLVHRTTGKTTKLYATVYVKESASKVSITNKQLADEVLPIGKNAADFDTVMFNANGDKTATRKTFVTDYRKWTSSDETVAIVDNAGRVTTLKEGTATLTVSTYVNKDFSDANGPTAKDSVTIQVGNALEEVKQQSLNTVSVTFSSDVSKTLTKSDFVITNKTTLIRQDIKSLTFTNDGKTCNLELYLDFMNDNIYEVSYNDTKQEFKAAAGNVTSVVVDGKPITYGVPASVNISLFDDNGINVTNETNLANLYITSDYGYYDAASGKLTLFNVGDKAVITAEYHTYTYDSTGSEITFRGQGVFTAVDAAPIALKGLTSNVGTSENWNNSNMYVALNDSSYKLFVKAVYSDDSVKTNADLTFESTDTNKLLIDDNGTLVPIAIGSVVVKIMDGNQIVGTATVTIRAARTATSVALDSSVVKLSKDVAADTATVTLMIRDQYGDRMPIYSLSISQTNTNSAPALVALSAEGDTIHLDGSQFKAAGVYRYEVKDDASGKTQVLTINVVTPGTAKSYRVVLENIPTDIKYVSGQEAPLAVGIKLFSYDASGNKVAVVTGGYGFTITKAGSTEASEVTAFTGKDLFTVRSEKDGEISFESGTYTVKVYLSSDGSSKEGLVTTAQFTINNTQSVPTITQDKKTITDGDAAAIAAGTPSSITNYFTVNANGAAGILSVDSVKARQIGTTLLVESITIRETFADGNYVLHNVVRNYTLSIR